MEVFLFSLLNHNKKLLSVDLLTNILYNIIMNMIKLENKLVKNLLVTRYL